jgi:hypothetical protein
MRASLGNSTPLKKSGRWLILASVTLSRVEFAGLAALPLNCPRCGHPMRYLHARTPDGKAVPANAPPTDSTLYVYACPQHGTMRLGLSTPLQREP